MLNIVLLLNFFKELLKECLKVTRNFLLANKMKVADSEKLWMALLESSWMYPTFRRIFSRDQETVQLSVTEPSCTIRTEEGICKFVYDSPEQKRFPHLENFDLKSFFKKALNCRSLKKQSSVISFPKKQNFSIPSRGQFLKNFQIIKT